jgi:hypothetical protein
MLELARSEEPATQLLAALRLAEHGALGAEDRARVAKLAAAGDPAHARIARAVLALAGDTSARPGLRADLAAPKADERALAAFALMSLGDWPGAAQALGDDSPEVRRAVACRMLAEPERELESHGSTPVSPFGPMAPELIAMLDDTGARKAKERSAKPQAPSRPEPKPKR